MIIKIIKYFILLLLFTLYYCQTSAQPTQSIRYGDVVYEFTEVKSKDGFITDTKVKIINQADGKVLYEDMLDEIQKDETKTGFQYLQEYRLIDLNGDGSDELILNGYVGMSPYFLFGNGYIIDKTKSYLPLYEIQNLDMQSIDLVDKIIRISNRHLDLEDIFYLKYSEDKLSVVINTKKPLGASVSEQFRAIPYDILHEKNICENFENWNKNLNKNKGRYWRYMENIFFNAHMNNLISEAMMTFKDINKCDNVIEMMNALISRAQAKYVQLQVDINDYYSIKYN